MAQEKDLRVHGTPSPKGGKWLNEVRQDAARNTIEHLRRQKEDREFEQAKARGITPEEIISKGKEDLEMPEAENASKQPKLEDQADSFEVEDLKKQLAAERRKNTNLQKKLEDQSQPADQPESGDTNTEEDK